jgi:hypothetical protein
VSIRHTYTLVDISDYTYFDYPLCVDDRGNENQVISRKGKEIGKSNTSKLIPSVEKINTIYTRANKASHVRIHFPFL